MTMIDFQHKPVLLQECIQWLDIKPNGVYVDCTLGGAGHSLEILKRLGPEGLLIGLDQDDDALAFSGEKLQRAGLSGRYTLIKTNFEHIDTACESIGVEKVDGILMDIGVSSWQLDEAERGFSYQQDAKLDMRMDRTAEKDAWMVVNQYTKEKLTEIFYKYGEEKWSARIAEFIVNERKIKPIQTTGELVSIIKKAVPAGARKDGPHPAKRTFQAIRIEVNDELGVLERAIANGFGLLRPRGQICCITFHSLEDRLVKEAFGALVKGCTCPPGFPVCVCGKKPRGVLPFKKPMEASAQELAENPRARSARLRVITKIE